MKRKYNKESVEEKIDGTVERSQIHEVNLKV